MGCASSVDTKDDAKGPVLTNHDGEADAPIVLTLGQVWDGKLGGEDSEESWSFYTFNTGNNTSVLVEVTNSSLPHVYPDASYNLTIHEGVTADTGSVIDAAHAEDSSAPILNDLQPNTNYTIELGNWGTEATTYQIRIVPVPAEANEGSADAPVRLNLGQTRTAYTTSADDGTSYYFFNSSVHESVTLKYTQPRLRGRLYGSSNFMNQFVSEFSPDATSMVVTGLQPNKDYYLAIYYYPFPYRCTFDLTVTGN